MDGPVNLIDVLSILQAQFDVRSLREIRLLQLTGLLERVHFGLVRQNIVDLGFDGFWNKRFRHRRFVLRILIDQTLVEHVDASVAIFVIVAVHSWMSQHNFIL